MLHRVATLQERFILKQERLGSNKLELYGILYYKMVNSNCSEAGLTLGCDDFQKISPIFLGIYETSSVELR